MELSFERIHQTGHTALAKLDLLVHLLHLLGFLHAFGLRHTQHGLVDTALDQVSLLLGWDASTHALLDLKLAKFRLLLEALELIKQVQRRRAILGARLNADTSGLWILS